MYILSDVLSVDRNGVVNQLCSIVVPLLLIYIGILCFWGNKLAAELLRKDTYPHKCIKIRTYGIIQNCIVALFLLFLVGYFALSKVWELTVFFVFALLGFGWIKMNTYNVSLTYTYRYLTVRTPRNRLIIPWTDVSKITWETPRGYVAYVLTIYYGSDSRILLSSSEFVGLVQLKCFFDAKRWK